MQFVIDAGELVAGRIVDFHEAGRAYTPRKRNCFVERSAEAEMYNVADWLLFDVVALVVAPVLALDCLSFVSETNIIIALNLVI